MKRLFLVILIVIAVCTVASADIDTNLSSYTDEELFELKEAVFAEQLARGKQVEVLGGRYTVGEDIPAGAYTITCANGGTNLTVWGIAYEDYKTNGGLLLNTVISSTSNPTLGKVILEEGNVVNFSVPLVFSKYTGISFE